MVSIGLMINSVYDKISTSSQVKVAPSYFYICSHTSNYSLCMHACVRGTTLK